MINGGLRYGRDSPRPRGGTCRPRRALSAFLSSRRRDPRRAPARSGSCSSDRPVTAQPCGGRSASPRRPERLPRGTPCRSATGQACHPLNEIRVKRDTAYFAVFSSASTSSSSSVSSANEISRRFDTIRLEKPVIRSAAVFARATSAGSSFVVCRRCFVLAPARSEEHTSELQSPYDLVCRLLLE